MRRPHSILCRWLPIVVCILAAASSTGAAPDQKPAKKTKPAITLRASPAVGFAPARFVLTAEIIGGPDDYMDFYCATVEWDWGDETRTENKADCDPYEAGKSEIKRRFVADRVFNLAGDFKVDFRLKQKSKVVGMASTEVKVRPGVRDGGDQ